MDTKILQIMFSVQEEDANLLYLDIVDKLGMKLNVTLKKFLLSKGFTIDEVEKNFDSLIDYNLVPGDWKMEEALSSAEGQAIMDEEINNYFKVYYDRIYPKLDPVKQKTLDDYCKSKQDEYLDSLISTYGYYKELLKSGVEVVKNDEIISPVVNLGGQQANSVITQQN
jgi:hypothetical protein